MDLSNLSIFWWIIATVFLFLEVITPTTIFIFPSIVAVLVGFLTLVVDNIWIQGACFFISSFIVLWFVRPLFVENNSNVGYKQGANALLGKRVRVKETINNNQDVGRIQHGGDNFPARSTDGSIIEKDSWVRIDKVEGITLFVSQDSLIEEK